MKIKKIFAKLLKKMSESMISMGTASASTIGIEEMPESMKALR